MNILQHLILASFLFANVATQAQEFVDDFSTPQFEGRLAERGEWKFEDGIASCVADPDLYKQFKNHGPILKWPREFNDATIEFEMKPRDCQRVVFTLNGQGHIFRVTLADETPDAPAGTSKVPTRIIAWATQSSKQNKGDASQPDNMPDLPAVNGKWVKIKLAVKGDHADLTIGKFQTQIDHAALGRDKNMVMLTFAHGELSVRDFRMVSEKHTEAPKDRSSQDAQPDRTNVIVVMADDLGIGDLSVTNPNCKIATPNLQAMADGGLTFTDAHTPSSVCTPTRYGLLTGRYNWRSRLAKGVLGGTSSHLIPADRPTLGHLMRDGGYHTAMIGKWHLGWDWHKSDGKIDFTKPVLNGPDINGFDQYYGHCGSLDMPPYVWVNTGRATAIPTREEGVTKQQDAYGWYRKGPISPDFKIDNVLPHLFEKSIDHIRQRAKADQPFFLYLALPAPHTPIVPVPPFKGASKINPYADFVMQVDHHMGQLMTSLQDSGIDDKTLVVFTSDNGCSPEANFDLLKQFAHDPSAGFRGHKADIYEGGHRVPLIVRWPGKIKGGRKSNALVCLTDIYSTLQAITGQPRKSTGGEDGFNLVPVFEGQEMSQRDTLISHSIGGSFAIRQGVWKLCLSGGSGGWSAPKENEARKRGLPPMQLFNLADDPSETTNLVEQNPDQVKTLLQLLAGQVEAGRCTPGDPVPNDREVQFLPKGVSLP